MERYTDIEDISKVKERSYEPILTNPNKDRQGALTQLTSKNIPEAVYDFWLYKQKRVL